MNLPPPNQIIASFERGEIEREEMQALMAIHARELIREMEEDYQNPAVAWIENLLARDAVGPLVVDVILTLPGLLIALHIV